MALLSFRGISTRAYRLKASNAAPSISTFAGTSPALPKVRRSMKEVSPMEDKKIYLLANWFEPSAIGWFAAAIYGAGMLAAAADASSTGDIP
jgi:hypothetical protein